ncbi:CD9 antigen-like isoform X2 [Haliotis cracherodii]|uniref:CD9 antigen-like isoform X2 n=1 Tax=Haliotis cracherodii TaxID=6455 RepID=UPI0039E8BE0A
MGLGSCYTCIKYLMFAFNFLFWLLGMAILAIGIWVRVDPNFSQYMDQTVSSNPTYVAAYLFIAVGCVVVVIGFFGCCGAIRESQCLLGLFFISLFIIFCVLLGAGIYCVVQKDSIKDLVGDFLQKSVDDYRERQQAKEAMDNIQKNLECCGAKTGSEDYPIATGVPETCKPVNYKRPCAEKLFKTLSSHLIIVAGVAIGIALIMILGMIFSMVLCCAIRDVNA